ncbi:tail length tape measure protein, partial [Corallococcus sp. CA031C]
MGRVTLGLAVLLPFGALGVREVLPVAPLFTFERSLARYTAPSEPQVARASPGIVSEPPAPGRGVPVAVPVVLLGVGMFGFLAWELRRYARLRRELEALPLLRRVGRVRVVLG